MVSEEVACAVGIHSEEVACAIGIRSEEVERIVGIHGRVQLEGHRHATIQPTGWKYQTHRNTLTADQNEHGSLPVHSIMTIV